MNDADCLVKINDFDKQKAQNEISDAAIGQVLKLHEYDVMK